MTGTFTQCFTKGLVLLTTFAMLFACSSGGDGSGGGDVEALRLPERIELTNVDDSSGSSRVNLSRGINMLYSDTGTDYANEEKHSWVDDTEALDMINDILGVCKDTGYEYFVNQGPYKALVRQVGDSEESQSGSNTTNTTTEQLMEMYVDVTRANNSAPMIVKIWVEEEDGPGEQAMLIRGHFTVTQGVSDAYPYGVMEAHFRGTTLDGGMDMFHMAMSVGAENGNVIIETVEDSEEGGDYGFHSRVQVVANSDVTQGNAYVWESDTWPDWETGDPRTETSTELIAFNEDYFRVTEDGTDSFYSKDNLMHRIFNYKLFNYEDGSKLDMNGGFPIETADGKHGYIGYWGIWAPHGASIDNGDTVADMDGVQYTVFRSRGKLTKHTQDSIALGELNGMELSKWECETECTDVIVSWSSGSGKFIKLGTRNQSNGMIEYLAPGDDGYNAEVTFSQWDGAWCESLRAYLRLGILMTPTDESTVYFHSEQTLDPQDATDLTLYTWEFTMDMPIDQAAVNSFNTDRDTYWGTPSEKTFYFDAANMILEDVDGNPATLGSDLTIPDGSDLQWGYHIGPLTTTHYNDDSAPFFWEAHEAETYYTWNTGNDDWNQFATLKDGNDEFVSFDAPISFSYTHHTANDINGDSSYDGKVFRMEYDGNSVFIPWEFDSTTQEWEPQINIKDGVSMGDTNQYVIKGTEESLLMTEIADPGTTFPDNSVGEPDLEYDPAKTAQVGAIPVNAQLKVIKGELIQ